MVVAAAIAANTSSPGWARSEVRCYSIYANAKQDFIWGQRDLWGLLGEREGLSGPLAVVTGCSV